MTDARTPRSLQVERSRRGLVLLWIVAVCRRGRVRRLVRDPPRCAADARRAGRGPGRRWARRSTSASSTPPPTTSARCTSARSRIDVDGEATVVRAWCAGTARCRSPPSRRRSARASSRPRARRSSPATGWCSRSSSDEPGEATIEPVEISFRDGLQWGTAAGRPDGGGHASSAVEPALQLVGPLLGVGDLLAVDRLGAVEPRERVGLPPGREQVSA